MRHYKKPIRELQYARGLLVTELRSILSIGRKLTPEELRERDDLTNAINMIEKGKSIIFKIKKRRWGIEIID